MHCISNYPTNIKDLNFFTIKLLKKKYNLDIGLSDHSNSKIAPSIAYMLGAKYFEKHITIFNYDKGPDHRASLNYKNFREMVINLKQTVIMLGNNKKKLNKIEKDISKISRKSIYAKKNISKSEYYTLNNLCIKRPQSGLRPYNLWNLLGKKAKKMYKTDDLIQQ